MIFDRKILKFKSTRKMLSKSQGALTGRATPSGLMIDFSYIHLFLHVSER